MGAPSKLCLGGKARTQTPSFSRSLNQHDHGCPIQALLGWESTNPNTLLLAIPQSARPRVPPSKLCLGGKARTQTPSISRSLNQHDQGCPIQALLGWENTNPNTLLLAIPQSAHDHGSSIQALLGWESTNPNTLLLAIPQSARPWISIQALLGWESTNPNTLLLAIPQSARPWVPHPSSAWVGKHEPLPKNPLNRSVAVDCSL